MGVVLLIDVGAVDELEHPPVDASFDFRNVTKHRSHFRQSAPIVSSDGEPVPPCPHVLVGEPQPYLSELELILVEEAEALQGVIRADHRIALVRQPAALTGDPAPNEGD